MDSAMRFAYWFAGGGVFHPALVIVVLALVALRITRNRTACLLARVTLTVGIILVVLSAVPINPVLYAAWLAALVIAVWVFGRSEKTKPALQHLALVAGVLMTSLIFGLEISHRMAPSIPFTKNGVLYTLGDSLSMGADTMDGNWPALLAKRADMKIHAFAFGGARLSTAMSNADRVEPDASLIIVELGGNDIFYDTPGSEFEADLDQMLERLTRHGAPVVLLELPLPPFYNRFGSAQRRLADKYGVLLVPRSVLARVLSTPGATVDGLHLSNAGHEMLADTIWMLRAE